MSEWTYHAQDAVTGAWISRDLRLIDVEITDVLTGHCSMKARIAPQDPNLSLMPEWGTFIYAEKFNAIRFGGILAGSTISEDGEALDLDVRSFTAYADGQFYGSKYRAWSADPLDCIRELWRFLQARDVGGGLYSNLGLVLDQDTSPVTISDVQPPPKPRGADVVYPTGSKYGTAGASWPRPAKPKRLNGKRPKKRKRRKGETDAHWNAYVSNYNSRLDAWQAKRKSVYTDRLPEWNAWHDQLDAQRQKWTDDYGDREPYTLYWWDQPDIGQEAARLAQEGGFEWRERHTWADPATKATVNHRLQLGYPTVGKTHTDALVVGRQQIAAVPVVTRGGDGWFNGFTVFGAGQGRKMLHATTSNRQGRLMRVGSASYKKVHRFRRAIAIARDECNARSVERYLTEVAIWDTNGDLGTYRLGDVVPITVANGWAAGGTTTTSHKIIGRRYAPDNDDLIFLQLDPAERSNT